MSSHLDGETLAPPPTLGGEAELRARAKALGEGVFAVAVAAAEGHARDLAHAAANAFPSAPKSCLECYVTSLAESAAVLLSWAVCTVQRNTRASTEDVRMRVLDWLATHPELQSDAIARRSETAEQMEVRP